MVERARGFVGTTKHARGFAAIGLHRPKCPANVGGVLRAAHVYDARLVCIAGDRASGRAKGAGHPADTTSAARHIPVLRGDLLRRMVPFDCVPIAVDVVPDAIPLPEFSHPQSAFYVFGPEDGTLGGDVLHWCKHRVYIPTQFCMNLAATVNVVLYDRLAKSERRESNSFGPMRAPSGSFDKRLHKFEGDLREEIDKVLDAKNSEILNLSVAVDRPAEQRIDRVRPVWMSSIPSSYREWTMTVQGRFYDSE